MQLADGFVSPAGFINLYLVGSSNGLVCIISVFSCKLLVCNPLTREIRQLHLSPWINFFSCRGFGYDSSRDDYDVIVGGPKYNQIQMLSLKSNIWKVVGEVKYTFTSKVGILSNGALHWIVRDNENMKKRLILSYDLCKQEFKEIPQPDDARYECTFDSFLGIITEHLCIYQYSCVWLMKSYDSWELLPRDRVIKNDVVHTLRMTRDDRFFNYDKSSFCKVSQVHFNFGLPVFVQSLVSPHVNGRPKHSSDDKMNAKGGPCALGSDRQV